MTKKTTLFSTTKNATKPLFLKIKKIGVICLLFLAIGFAFYKIWQSVNFYSFVFPKAHPKSSLFSTAKEYKKIQNYIEYYGEDYNKKSNKIATYIQELLLGPISVYNLPLLPTNTQVGFCAIQQKTLFLDIDFDINATTAKVQISKGLFLLQKNIKHNFKDIKEIVLFVNKNQVRP